MTRKRSNPLPRTRPTGWFARYLDYLTVDRTEDLIAELGMEGEAALDHPGRRVQPPRQVRVAALTTVALQPLILLQPTHTIAAGSTELLR